MQYAVSAKNTIVSIVFKWFLFLYVSGTIVCYITPLLRLVSGASIFESIFDFLMHFLALASLS